MKKKQNKNDKEEEKARKNDKEEEEARKTNILETRKEEKIKRKSNLIYFRDDVDIPTGEIERPILQSSKFEINVGERGISTTWNGSWGVH